MRLINYLAAAILAVLPLVASAQTKYPRGLLIEYYTGAMCANCPPQATALKTIVADEGDPDRLVWITHHYGYYSDSLTIEASKAPADLCGIGGAPHVIFNRTLTRLGSGLPALSLRATTMLDYNNFLRSSQGKSFIQQEMEAGADISIDMDVTYDETTRDLTVKVYGEKNEAFAASNPTLTLYLVERTWVGFQRTGYDGSPTTEDLAYHHMNPVRLLLSADPLGDAVEFAEDGNYAMTYETTVPERIKNWPYDGAVPEVEVDVNTDSLYIAAFVANIDETPVSNINYDRDNIKVYNAVKCPLGNHSTVGISEAPAQDRLAITVNDGTVAVDGRIDGFDIYNLAGQVVPNGGLPRGIYLVRVVDDGTPVVRKILVD